MAFATLLGIAPGSVQASGLQEQPAGSVVSGTRMNSDDRELQQPSMQALLCGVLAGSDPTASGLTISFPAGFRYFARQIWEASGTTQVSVPDSATTYLWGCADGQIRQTSSATVPGGWTDRTACLIAKATASGGVAVLDFTVQHRGRYADSAGRVVVENSGAWCPTPHVIPSGSKAVVPINHQVMLFETVTVVGTLLVLGKMRVIA